MDALPIEHGDIPVIFQPAILPDPLTACPTEITALLGSHPAECRRERRLMPSLARQ